MATSDKIHLTIFIPIFFTLLAVASTVAIIGNSLILGNSPSVSGGTDTFNEETSRIFKIIVSAILAAIFILSSVFLYVEILKPNDYEPRIITPSFEKRINEIANNAESFEILLLVIAFLSIPIGTATTLISGLDDPFLIAGIAAFLVAYYLYSLRMNIRQSLKRTIPLNSSTNLGAISQLIGRDNKRVKKELIHLITYENFPVEYNFETEELRYNGEGFEVVQSSSTLDINQVTASSSPQVPECEYCGTKALVMDAKFCSECGASMVPAK